MFAASKGNSQQACDKSVQKVIIMCGLQGSGKVWIPSLDDMYVTDEAIVDNRQLSLNWSAT